MLMCNHTSRYHVAIEAIKVLIPLNPSVASTAGLQIADIQLTLKNIEEYIDQNNSDPKDLQTINIPQKAIE